MYTTHHTPPVYRADVQSLSHYSPLQAGKRTDSFRVSWSLVRAWVFRGSHHTTTHCYVIFSIRNFTNKFFVTTNMQGTNSLIYLFWIIQVSLKSFCLFVLIVCCSSHISQYTTWWICIQTQSRPQSLFSWRDKNQGTHDSFVVKNFIYVGLRRKKNKAPYQIWQKLSLKALS